MAKSTWRLIPFLTASGIEQMAIDRWLLRQHYQGHAPPTLRFYTWSPVAISLGCYQQNFPDYWQQLIWQEQPIEIVRRPTGGRAVLHQGELTYAIVTSGITGSRVRAYQQLCQFLQQGWHHLGLDLDYGQKGKIYHQQPNCFASSTAADLVDAMGHKIIGSAQLYQGKAILQHGSMRLCPDTKLFRSALNEVIPSSFPYQKLSRIPQIICELTKAAKDCFQADFLYQPLSSSEKQFIGQLLPKMRLNI